MATKVGPVQGVYVPVKLPWKGVTSNEDQFSSIKRPIVEYFKLEIAKKEDLTYKAKVSYKERNADGKPVGALKTKEVDRLRRPGRRQRAIKVIFGDRDNGTPKKVKVGKQSRFSIQFPVTTSVSIAEIHEEFITGRWKSLPVIRIEDTSTGQGYPVY